ncbi:acetyl-CoA carboxylase [Lactobacillus sp. Sy-1]|uniref:acetyl-CoA carboxylase n=1 Tax=Lactobacillus sp. Sy-1 TaxID=2109645 RepID=UPI001C5B64FB|nr:acetyl-CoA carboxylase [Lactobacillus sp. Sy-1]MBW1606217.1 acetyl-CoA carboxylase [Lactobacillus sp. Sy-1]
MNEDEARHHAAIIFRRLTPWFKRLPNTMYRLIVVNDIYDSCYNFYIEISRKNTLTRLVPLHEISDYDLDSLALILKALNRDCHLPIKFRNFTDANRKRLSSCFR